MKGLSNFWIPMLAKHRRLHRSWLSVEVSCDKLGLLDGLLCVGSACVESMPERGADTA